MNLAAEGSKISVRSAQAIAQLLIVAASFRQAAQPLVTDDAAVVAAKTCQPEARVRSTHDGKEYSTQQRPGSLLQSRN
jgi:hypothetical protein